MSIGRIMQRSYVARFSPGPVTSRDLPDGAAQDGPRLETAHRQLARLRRSDCLPIAALPGGNHVPTAWRIKPAAVDLAHRVSCILAPASWNAIKQIERSGKQIWQEERRWSYAKCQP